MMTHFVDAYVYHQVKRLKNQVKSVLNLLHELFKCKAGTSPEMNLWTTDLIINRYTYERFNPIKHQHYECENLYTYKWCQS